MKKLIAAIIIAASVPAQAATMDEIKLHRVAGYCSAIGDVIELKDKVDSDSVTSFVDYLIYTKAAAAGVTHVEFLQACASLIQQANAAQQSTPA